MDLLEGEWFIGGEDMTTPKTESWEERLWNLGYLSRLQCGQLLEIIKSEKQLSYQEGVEEMASRILVSYNFIPDNHLKDTLIESSLNQLSILKGEKNER